VPADAEIGQKWLRCRSEKRFRETPVTLPAAVKPPAGSLSNPLVALAGWIGQLVMAPLCHLMSPQARRARWACISRAAGARERGAAPRGASGATQPPGAARGPLRLPARGATAAGRVAGVSEGGSARCGCPGREGRF
jgi:hypothetical protein